MENLPIMKTQDPHSFIGKAHKDFKEEIILILHKVFFKYREHFTAHFMKICHMIPHTKTLQGKKTIEQQPLGT